MVRQPVERRCADVQLRGGRRPSGGRGVHSLALDCWPNSVRRHSLRNAAAYQVSRTRLEVCKPANGRFSTYNVAHDLTVYDRTRAVGCPFKRVAVVHGQVGVLSFFEGADPLLETQDPGSVDGDQ